MGADYETIDGMEGIFVASIGSWNRHPKTLGDLRQLRTSLLCELAKSGNNFRLKSG